MTKVKLNSDFIDVYDHWFDLDGDVVFNRRMDMGPNRIEMYKMLNAIGLKTPKFGMVADLYKDLAEQWGGTTKMHNAKYDQAIEMVVYTNVNSHAGEDKIKVTLEEAREKYPGHFASQHIPPNTKVYAARTERLLVVGREHFWLEYLSKNDWRSNCGEVIITSLDRAWMQGFSQLQRTVQIRELQVPLYAIDFVNAGHERLAIDFNVSPGIKGTPVEHLIPGEEIALAIKDKISDMMGVQIF